MTNNSGDKDDILEQVRYDIFRHLLPIIVSMIVFGVAGVVGNILAFIFYAFKCKRASTVVLIACLAVVDVTVCVLFIPNIAEMWVNVKYTQSFLCQLAHFIGLWVVATSGLILWVVSIDRHRKICYPFGRQMTLTTAKYAVIGIVVFGFSMSVRNFANFDAVEIDVIVNASNETVKGRYCTTRDDSNYIVSVTLFTVVDFLLMLVVWFTLAIVYSRIIYTLFKLKRTRKLIQKNPKIVKLDFRNAVNETKGPEIANRAHKAQCSDSSEHVEHDVEGSDEKASVSPVIKHPSIQEQPDISSITKNKINTMTTQETKHGKQGPGSNANSLLRLHQRTKGKGSSQQRINSNVSLTLTSSNTQISEVHSGEYSASHVNKYLPDGGTLPSDSQAKSHSWKGTFRRKAFRKYNSAKSARERNLTFKMLTVSLVFIICFTPYFIVKIWMREVLKSGEEYELSLWSQIALRLPYMNSVFNPVVYCVFNPQFRLFIKGVFIGFVSKCLCK